MVIRYLALYFEYLLYRIKYRWTIWFRGFSVIHAFKGKKITLPKIGIPMMIFSSPMSNMIGLPHRCIIVARD